MKIFYYTLIAALFFSLTASASERMKTFVEQDYGNDEIHGLAYVNDKAKEFISEYNKQHNTHWQTNEPNAKYVLSKCVVPLKAKWHKIFMDEGKSKWVVSIYCDKTVDKIPSKWEAHVGIFEIK